eukprot:6202609-Pleurochrysis_carterae.AAC.2
MHAEPWMSSAAASTARTRRGVQRSSGVGRRIVAVTAALSVAPTCVCVAQQSRGLTHAGCCTMAGWHAVNAMRARAFGKIERAAVIKGDGNRLQLREVFLELQEARAC